MALSVQGLTVRYGQFTAVRDATLDIADGEVLALLGPSGSGKSTLLRAITGLEPLSSGTVRWDGEDLARIGVHRREFGLVFQDGQLFPHRDVAGNISFGLRMKSMPARERAERVRGLLELVGLGGYERRRVTELSGGEAQRVALARALAPEPRLLLLDEPLSGLDAELRQQLAFDLAEVLRSAKITALLVTHDREEAFTFADRVAVLRAGEIRQAGAVREVWRHPVDDEVAAFLGVTAFFDGTVSGGRLSFPLGEAELAEPDGPVRVGLRPDGLRVSGEGIPGEVLSKVHRRVRVRVADSTVDALAPADANLRPGEETRLAVDPEGVVLISRRAS